jgi:hypothetical protein
VGISLVATVTDWSWIPNSPNLVGTESNLMVGNYDSSPFYAQTNATYNATTLTITSVALN